MGFRGKTFGNKLLASECSYFKYSFSVSAEIYDAQLSPMEAVVLNAMLSGSSILNLKAHFLSQLPDLSRMAGMLTHLNLSFNQLWVSKRLLQSGCDFFVLPYLIHIWSSDSSGLLQIITKNPAFSIENVFGEQVIRKVETVLVPKAIEPSTGRF